MNIYDLKCILKSYNLKELKIHGIPIRQVSQAIFEPWFYNDFKDLFTNLNEKINAGEMNKLCVTYDEIDWKFPIPKSCRNQPQALNFCDLKDVKECLQSLINREIIKEMKCDEKAFFSQALFIKKKTGKPRLVNDYCRLNTLSYAWTCEIPSTISIVQSIPNTWRYFKTMDIQDGFFAIPIEKKLQQCFVFEALGTRYMWLKMPQGWHSSPCIFHDRVRRILYGTKGINYIDDIIVGGNTMEEHDLNLMEVLF